MPEGERKLLCSEDEAIFEVAAREGIRLPAICMGGACSTCVGRLLEGVAPDQEEQTYLTEADVERGFVLLCVAFARGECRIATHQTEAFTASLG